MFIFLDSKLRIFLEKILNLIKVVCIGKNSYDFKHSFKLMYFKQITEQFLNLFS